jgi:hypothetical protein
MASTRLAALVVRVSKTREGTVAIAEFGDRSRSIHAVREDGRSTWCGVMLGPMTVVTVGGDWVRVSCRRCKGGW